MSEWPEYVEVKLENAHDELNSDATLATVAFQSDHSYCKRADAPRNDIELKEEWLDDVKEERLDDVKEERLDDVVMEDEIDKEQPDISTPFAAMPISSSCGASFRCLVPRNPRESRCESDNEEASEEQPHSRIGKTFEVIKLCGNREDLLMEGTDHSDSDDGLVDPCNSDNQALKRNEKNDVSSVRDGSSPARLVNGAQEDDMTADSDVSHYDSNDNNYSQHGRGNRGPNLGDWLVKKVPKPVRRGRIQKKRNFKWKKKPFKFSVKIPEENNDVQSTNSSSSSPIHYFKRFFTDELLQMIVNESNHCSTQEKLTVNDLRNFISIEITMGFIKVGNWKSYWAHQTRISRVADTMSRNKYENIRSRLHFAASRSPVDPNDKYLKIRPLAEYLRRKFMDINGVDRKFSIDEMWIPYKTMKASRWHRLMSVKPTKFGFKMYARSGISGIVYDYFLYAGEHSFDYVSFEGWELGEDFPSKCVLALCQSIEAPALSVVFLNDFFSSLSLIRLLRSEYGILSIGTVRPGELDTMASDEELLERGRGAFDQVSDNHNKVTIVKWADTEVVTLASSYAGVEPLGKVSKMTADKKRESIDCPRIVKEYKSFMLGEDTLATVFKTPLWTFKWYMAIFSHLLNLTLSNAWLLYLHENPEMKMSFFDFRVRVSDALLARPQEQIKTALPTQKPSNELRLDSADHFPVFTNRGRCRACRDHQIKTECSKCRMRLCIVPGRNCFLIYHTNKELPKNKYIRRKRKRVSKQRIKT